MSATTRETGWVLELALLGIGASYGQTRGFAMKVIFEFRISNFEFRLAEWWRAPYPRTLPLKVSMEEATGDARGWLIENRKSKIENRKSKIENRKFCSVPAAFSGAEVGQDEAGQDVGEEDPAADGEGGEIGAGGHLDDVVEAGVTHGLDITGPSPIGGDEGTGDPADSFGQGEDGAGEGQLKADEIDADERGMVGGFHLGGDAEAHAGHGGVYGEENAGLGEEIAGKMADGIDKEGHPEGLGGKESSEVDGLAGEERGGAEAGEFFLLKDGPLAGDLAGGIIRAHEGKKDDLKHDKPGDETADADGLEGEGGVRDELLEGILARDADEIGDLRQSVPGEDDDETREAEEEGKLEEELAVIAKKEAPLAGEQDAELGEPGGIPESGGILLVFRLHGCQLAGWKGIVDRRAVGGFVDGAGDGGLGIDEAGVIIGAMLAP